VGLLDDAVLIRFAGLDARRAQGVVVEHGLETAVELAPALRQRVRRGREVIAAQHARHAAEVPERTLEPSDERLERLAERERHEAPLAKAQDELEQEVREELTGDAHPKRAAVGEVDRRLATWHVLLLEEHLFVGPVQRTPVAHAPLQRTQVPLVETTAMTTAELGENRCCLEGAGVVALEQRHDVRLPNAVERIDPRAPGPRRLRLRRQRARLPVVSASRAHVGHRCGGLDRLSFSHFQPQQLNLLVRDHRAPEAPATWPEPLGSTASHTPSARPGSANLIVVDLQK
jgi:hypothetical protein